MDETTPTIHDLENCRLLLRFIEISFSGATINRLKMDDLAASFRRVLESIPKEGPDVYRKDH